MATHQQTQPPSDFPALADENSQIPEATKPANEVQQATIAQDPPTSVFKNSEPIREDQIQNAIKFLSHPRVRGSPVIHRRSFLERKGLTKEEIDEAFRRVPDPPPSSQTTVTTSQDGQQAVSTVQPQAMQPVVAAPAPLIVTPQAAFLSRFRWYHAILAVGVLAASGAGTAVFIKVS
jgi:peroxin-14